MLLALDSRCRDSACACFEADEHAFDAAALVLDARSSEWSRARLDLGARAARPRAGVRAFEVVADGEAHPLELHELGRSCHVAVDPGTGLLCVTDDEGSTCGIHRLRAAPGNARRTVLETLRVRRTQAGTFPPVVVGARLVARWVAVATFASNDRWLFVNVHAAGVSFAITGPRRPGRSGS